MAIALTPNGEDLVELPAPESTWSHGSAGDVPASSPHTVRLGDRCADLPPSGISWLSQWVAAYGAKVKVNSVPLSAPLRRIVPLAPT